MKIPLVSVLVIAYNQKNYIRETIESVIQQDYPNLEYIIADDGSTDGTAEIIEAYSKKYHDKIIAITGVPNVGITKNSNRGLAYCKGEYIALQGGDDVFLPCKIRKQVEWLEKDPMRVLCGHYLFICDKNSNIAGKYHTQKVAGKGPKAWIERGPLYGATSVMIRSTCIPGCGFDERLPLSSDWKLYIDSLSDNAVYGYLPEFLGMYRKHCNNITNIKEPLMLDALKTLDIVEHEKQGYDLAVKIGRAYILDYGRGYQCLERLEYKEAIFYFLKSIFRWPFNWKPYFRLGQSLLYIMLNLRFKG